MITDRDMDRYVLLDVTTGDYYQIASHWWYFEKSAENCLNNLLPDNRYTVVKLLYFDFLSLCQRG